MSIFSAEVLTGLLAIVLVAGLLTRRKRLPLPPGPPGLPILGNIYDVPKTHEWLAYQQWARDFDSDVIYLNLCGTPVVVVNSTEAAFELFERRSSLYSDRPRMTMLNDLVGCDWHFVFMAYGDRWRERRRIFHQHFHAAASLQHRTRVIKGARLLVRRLREAPEDFISHLRHMAGALIVGVSYGLEVKPKDDPYVETAEKALHAISMAGNAGAYLVDSIPTLKYVPAWFPGAKFKREAAEWRKACRAMLEVPFAAVKKAISDGIASPSLIVSRLNELNEDEDNSYQEGLYSGVAAAAYVGGSDTVGRPVRS
ncbi:hypothetical protein AcW1_002368 [Taiwanofungus camphoratus]|nr:hypothetical protein AcV5_010375 [Antrodia cinnamomea]KAI0944730.1 hypothetical protein AcW1_002368 [Antrodia cinnamomea]